MEKKDWVSKIILSSIPIRQLDELRKPVGFASGCLIDYFNKRIIMTVAHATGNNKNWGIEIKSKEMIGTQLYNIGAMTFLTLGNISTDKIKDVDFSFATVPNDLQPLYQEINETGEIINQIPREILHVNFDIEPSTNKKYGFFGQSNFSIDNSYLHSQSKLVLDLKYVGLDEDYYKFKLPAKHPGHDYFRGSSGAPILDTDGNAIALVCYGDDKEDLIFGVALKKYKSAIDIEVGNFNK